MAAATRRGSAFLTVWRLDGLTPERVLDDPAGVGTYSVLSLRADGRHLAVVNPDRLVSLYDLSGRRGLWHRDLGCSAQAQAFHPRDGRLAMPCGSTVRLFDVDADRELPPLRHTAPVTRVDGLAWYPDGRRLVAGCDDMHIHVWDADAGAEVMPPWAWSGSLGIRPFFNGAGDLLGSVCEGGQTSLWDPASGRLLLTVPFPFTYYFSRDGQRLGYQVAGNKVRLYRVAAGRGLRRFSHGSEPTYTRWLLDDGRTLATYWPGALRFFDLDSAEELGSASLPPEIGYNLWGLPAPGGFLMTVPGAVWFWPARTDPARGNVLRVGPPERVAALRPAAVGRFGADRNGRVLAVPEGDHAVVLDRDRPGRRIELGPHHNVLFVAVSPNGRWVATGSKAGDGESSQLKVWEAATGRHERDLPLAQSNVPGFSPDGRWLAASTSGRGCRLWEVGTWRERPRWGDGWFAFSPDGRVLALNDVFRVVRLVEPDTGREIARLTGPEPLRYFPAGFTPDGSRLIASGANRTVYVWNLRALGEELRAWWPGQNWLEFPPAEEAPPDSRTRRVEVLGAELIQHAKRPE
jgi:WD40 repeat protein